MTPLLPLFLSLVPSAQDHSPLHPAGASLFMQAPDIAGLISAYEQSAYAKLMQDPELLEAIGNVLGEEDFNPLAVLEAEIEAAENSGDIPSIRPLLASLRAISMSVNLRDNDLGAFVSAARGGGGMSSEKMMEQKAAQDLGFQFVIDFADAQSASDTVALLFETLSDNERSAVATSEVDGPRGKMKRWSVETEDEPMASTMELFQDGSRLWWRLGDLDVQTQVERMGGKGSTVAERMGAMNAGMGVRSGVSLLEVHNRLGDQVLELIEAEMGVDGVSSLILQLLEGMGGPGYSMLLRNGAWRVSADGGRFMTQGMHTAPSGSLLDGAIGGKNLSPESMSLVHPEAIAGGVVSLDADRISAWIRQKEEENESNDLAQVQQAYGFHPVDDLIEPLGGAMAWSLNGNFGISAPPFQIAAEVRDAEALRRGIAGLARLMADDSGEMATITSKPYRGFDVTTVKFNGDAFEGSGMPMNPADMVQPTFVVLEDRVVMTLNSIQAKREIKRVIKGNAELNPLLASDAIPDGGAGDIGFANWIEVVGRLYSAGKSFAPMMMGQMDGAAADLDLTALPNAELFTRHFSTSYNWKRVAQDGMQYYGESSFGLEGNALPLAFLASVGGFMTASNAQPVPLAIASGVPGPAVEVENGPERAQANIATLQAAVSQFQTNNGGRLPENLSVLFMKDSSGNQYVPGTNMVDPWGNEYLYWVSDDRSHFAIWSAGSNGVDDSGEGDDIIADL